MLATSSKAMAPLNRRACDGSLQQSPQGDAEAGPSRNRQHRANRQDRQHDREVHGFVARAHINRDGAEDRDKRLRIDPLKSRGLQKGEGPRRRTFVVRQMCASRPCRQATACRPRRQISAQVAASDSAPKTTLRPAPQATSRSRKPSVTADHMRDRARKAEIHAGGRQQNVVRPRRERHHAANTP